MKMIKLKGRLAFYSIAMLVAGGLLFAFNGYYWYSSVYSRPERMVRDAFSTALETRGVTYQTTTSQSDVNLHMTSRLSFAGSFTSQTLTDATSTHDKSKINTEVITVGNSQYMRYRQLSSPVVTSKANYENIWTVLPSSTAPSLSYFGRAMIATPVPLANLEYARHADIMSLLDSGKVYALDRVVQKNVVIDGQRAVVIRLAVDSGEYSRLLRELFKTAGLTADYHLYQSNDSAVGQRLYMEVAISYQGHQFLRAAWGSLSNTMTTSYSGWGVGRDFAKPDHTISFDELQRRIFSGSI